MRDSRIPPSSLAFDWVMAVLAALVMAGVIQDGWAHNHGLVDQSFFTPWHAILYSCMALSGIVLAATGFRNLSRGYPFRRALPYGYWTCAIGVVLFATGGVFDLFWHTLYGIETDITGLISVSHLWLALGGALVFSGPIRSIAYRYGPRAAGWKIAGPLVLCAAALLTLLGFFTQYASLFADNTTEAVMTANAAQLTGGQLFTVRANGAFQTRVLTVARHDVWGAAASPDGNFIAYRVQNGVASASLPPSDIYVARADGSHAVRITHSGRHDTQAAWSPDGTRLAYVSMPAGTSGNFAIVSVRRDGSDTRTVLSGTTTVQNPAWSPNGRSILFESRNGLHGQLAIVPARGGAIRWLPATIDGAEPQWSRAGRIVFDKTDGALLLTDASGTKVTPLRLRGSEPALSPDGSRIAFVANANGAAQIFVAPVDPASGNNVTQLASQDASHPTWLSNDRLAFTAAGRAPAIYTQIGKAYSINAFIVSSLIAMGLMLLLVRRWRLPFGAITVLLALYSAGLATQSDTYWDIPAALASGIVADVLIAVLKERARSGNGFYALAFIVPFLMAASYVASVRLVAGALWWPANMTIGTPFIAGFAGLLVSFCFAPPLPVAVTQSEPEPYARLQEEEPGYATLRA